MLLARGAVALVLAAFALGAAPAQAGCTLLLVLNTGTLARSADGTRLASDEPGGVAAVVNIVSLGSSTLTIAAPTLTQSPAGFNSGGSSVQVAYSGTGLLSAANQPYTTSQTSVTIPNIVSALPLTINNRINSPSGFTSGTYQTRTVVTCS